MNKPNMSTTMGPLSRRSFLSGGAGVATLIATGAGATLLLSGCSTDSTEPLTPASSGALDPVTGRYMTAFGLNLSFVEVLVAQERGYFKDLNFALDIKGGQGTAPAIQAVLGGSVDISRTSAINAIVAASNEGAPLRTIGTVRQKSQFDVCSLASKPIKNPKELAGKTVGVVSAGGSTENLLDIMLIGSGVDLKSVTRPITGVGTAAFELAKNGQIDAWISVDTDRRQINDELGELYYFNTDEFAKIPSDTYNVSQATIDSGSDMPARFLAGVLKAMTFAADEANWEQVIKDLQVYAPDVDTESTLASMPILVDGWTSAGMDNLLQLDEATWKSGQDLLVEAGVVKSALPVDKLIYQKYLDDARKM
jgi:NitT/TauT family transport system substrate-binding protein